MAPTVRHPKLPFVVEMKIVPKTYLNSSTYKEQKCKCVPTHSFKSSIIRLLFCKSAYFTSHKYMIVLHYYDNSILGIEDVYT